MPRLAELGFAHGFVDALPADPSRENLPRQVRASAYSFVSPTPVRNPRIVGWSEDLARDFGLSTPPPSGEEAEILVGNRLAPGMVSYAACYGGHQFGNWAGQLGDGRAITLGEARDLRGAPWEFQLKGAGPTPYSRRADGRAVLRSSIREFVCSEAMHALGVPTTRALSVATTGEEVVRDMFYDGNARPEIGAVVCRVSPSFVRFGNFELFAARGETDLLRKLADYVIDRFFPELPGEGDERYLAWYLEVVSRTALLMTEWTRVGFVHGVMNTDNLSILGLTIDYGPYGWMDNYDPSWTPNTTDLPGRRYCFGRQPGIAHWNLSKLAGAVHTLVPSRTEAIQAALDSYAEIYGGAFGRMMGAKLGLRGLGREGDEALLVELENLLVEAETDMTLFYRGLAELPVDRAWDAAGEHGLPSFLERAFYGAVDGAVAGRWRSWLEKYQARVRRDGADPLERVTSMRATNPLYVPRNYLLQEAIDRAERGDPSRVAELLEVFRNPYAEQPGREAFAAKRPAWAVDKPGCSTLSCSS